MRHESQDAPISILYVEDEPITREMVAGLLEERGYTVHLAENGEEGLEEYRRLSPDIIISDLMMPVLNGLEMTRRIRDDDPTKQIIIISAHGDTEYLLEAINVGISHFVMKPLDFTKLFQVVEECVLFVGMQRKLAEQNEQIALLVNAIEQSPVITMITDADGRIDYVNSRCAEVTGYTVEEMIGEKVRVLKSNLMPPQIYEDLWKTVLDGREWHGELHNRKKSGDLYWEDARIAPILDEGGRIVKFIKVAEDVTETKRLREEVLNARKLEAIGTLAGGIAHDFNNLLQVIICNLFLISREMDPESPLHPLAADAHAASQKAKELNSRLLAFARQAPLEQKVLELPQIIAAAVNATLKGTGIVMDMSFPEDLWPVAGDQSKLAHVMTHIATNAREAMGASGRFRVSAENIQLDAGRNLPLPPGKYVKITLVDDGHGIPREDLPRLFDPYFSTRNTPTRKGNGLGLAICHTIMRNHRGLIVAESEEGAGAQFSLYLPVATPTAGPVSPVPAVPPHEG